VSTLAEVTPGLVRSQIDAVDKAEDNELQARPMPNAGEQHGNHVDTQPWQ